MRFPTPILEDDIHKIMMGKLRTHFICSLKSRREKMRANVICKSVLLDGKS